MSAIQFTTVVGPDRVIRPPVGVTLPEGEVHVAVQSKAAALDLTYAWLLELAAEAEADPACQNLPSDMAENHDHYAHGAPKR